MFVFIIWFLCICIRIYVCKNLLNNDLKSWLSVTTAKNSLITREKNTKKIIAMARIFICDKTHMDFHKTFALIFSAFTIPIFCKQTNKMGIKWIVSEVI